MADPLRWEFTDIPQASDLQAIDAGLHLYNLAAADLAAVRPLACFARGATVIYLDTFSFQAPEFYRRCGDESALRIDGFPDGIAKHLMTKQVGGGQGG